MDKLDLERPFLSELDLFQEPKHKPFLLTGGHPAALLVHGFPGTPAEMRPIAKVLNDSGWTARGMLLPGFGDQITTMPSRNHKEWVQSTVCELNYLREKHSPVILIGYSMGGAVAINAAAETSPSGLILLAPFWRMSGILQTVFWQIFKRVRSSFTPFKRVSFDNPRVRMGLKAVLPDIDLESKQVQESLRSLEIPNQIITEIELLGKKARKVAPEIETQTLLLHGSHDRQVNPKSSRKLARFLNGNLSYHELEANHKLTANQNGSWDKVSGLIVDFASMIKNQSTERNDNLVK